MLEKRAFPPLGDVSVLTIGGGGIGNVWGKESEEERVATLREAVESGINLIDVAPSYGRGGEAERIVGLAFGGHLPDGVLISTKCDLSNVPPDAIARTIDESLAGSLSRMRRDTVDMLFLHNLIVPDALAGQVEGTPLGVFREFVRPAFERLVAAGTIRCWAISAFGVPSAIIDVLEDEPRLAAIQAVSNLLDAVGEMPYDEPSRPREIIAAATDRGVSVMGVRAVHAGALTDAIDRELRDDHPLLADFRRAEPFRAIARELGYSSAALAHRYALSMPGVTTLVLGVKHRAELRECIEAAKAGPLSADIYARLDALRTG